MNLDDTIIAIATPPGRGGIGVVRIAGPAARAIVAPMLRLKRELEPGRAIFGELIEPCGAGVPARETAGTTLTSENTRVVTGLSPVKAEQSSATAATIS